MQNFQPSWGLQAQLNSLAMLPVAPVMRAPALNVVPYPCPPFNMPQLLQSRSPANDYKTTLKAQARIQTQQIDSAIQLLKMQYDAIMVSVQQSHNQPVEKASTLPSKSATTSQVVDHDSFANQFDLPDPEFDAQIGTSFAIDSAVTFKRKNDSHSDGMSIKSLVDTEASSPTKTSESNLQPKKRLRTQ
jgi:hypothetical protein